MPRSRMTQSVLTLDGRSDQLRCLWTRTYAGLSQLGLPLRMINRFPTCRVSTGWTAVSVICRVVSVCAVLERAKQSPAASKNKRFISFLFSFLVKCYLEGSNQDLPVAVAVAVCRFCEGSRHFPEDAAEFRLGRSSRFVGTKVGLAPDSGLFFLQGLGRKGRLVFRNAGLDSKANIGCEASRYRHVHHGDSGFRLVHPFSRIDRTACDLSSIDRTACDPSFNRIPVDSKVLLLIRPALGGLPDGLPLVRLRLTFY